SGEDGMQPGGVVGGLPAGAMHRTCACQPGGGAPRSVTTSSGDRPSPEVFDTARRQAPPPPQPCWACRAAFLARFCSLRSFGVSNGFFFPSLTLVRSLATTGPLRLSADDINSARSSEEGSSRR